MNPSQRQEAKSNQLEITLCLELDISSASPRSCV